MPPKPNWPVWLTLLLILLLACWLRWTSLGDDMWIDELHTTWIVSGSWDDIPKRAMIGNLSPLLYWPFWLYVQAVGLNEFTMRLPFFLASVAVVGLVFGMTWSWSRSLIAAATAALLVATNDYTIFYGVEARIYAAVQLIGLVHWLMFLDLLDRPAWWRRVTWILLGALLLHLHYTTLLLLVVEALSYVMICYTRPDPRPRYSIGQFAMDGALSLLFLLPMLGQLTAIAGRRANWALAIERQPSPLAILIATPIAELVVAPLLLLGIFKTKWFKAFGDVDQGTGTSPLSPWPLWACLIWMLVPPAALWMASFLNIAQAFHVRYMAYALVAPMIMAGLLIGSAPRHWQQVIMATITLAIALSWNTSWREPFFGRPAVARHQPWQEAVQTLNELLPNSTKPVFIYSGYIESETLRDDGQDEALLREFCYSPVRTCYWLDCDDARIHPLRFLQPGKLSAVNTKACAAKGGWFIIREHDTETFKRAVEASLQAQGVRHPFAWKQYGPEEMPVLELSIGE